MSDARRCGCSETSIHPLYIARLKNIGVLTKHVPSPFDKDRAGFTPSIGEGACFVVIEGSEKALKRNTKVYCEIAGYSNDIYSDNTLTIKNHLKMKNIIKIAAKSTIPDYIHMHGTGTKLNDYNESIAVSEVFDKNAKGYFFKFHKSSYRTYT